MDRLMPVLPLRATLGLTRLAAKLVVDRFERVGATGLSVAITFFFTTQALAQVHVAGSLSLQSNQTFRGETISRDDPGSTAAISFDGPVGLFAGGDVSVAGGADPVRVTASSQYAGVAFRTGQTSLEFGALHRNYRDNVDTAYRRDFFEGFVGVTHKKTKLRLFVSPDYLRDGRNTYYAEVETKLLSVEKWTLDGRAGLSVIPPDPGEQGTRYYRDWGLTVGREVKGFSLSFGVTATNYPVVGASGKARFSAVIGKAF